MDFVMGDCFDHLLMRKRNVLICTLLLETGLRVSELANLKISELKEGLQIIGKGGARRLVYLFPKHLALINAYLQLRACWKSIKSDFLFVSLSQNSFGKKLSRNAIAKVVAKIAEKAGIEKRVYPHLFRHTFVTNLLRKGANVYHIQRLLGHKHITTTQLYLDATNQDLKEAQKLILGEEEDGEVCSPILKG